MGDSHFVRNKRKHFGSQSVIVADGFLEMPARNPAQRYRGHRFCAVKVALAERYAENIACIEKTGDDTAAICYNFEHPQYAITYFENMCSFVPFKEQRASDLQMLGRLIAKNVPQTINIVRGCRNLMS
ncbi:hypothetical protein D3C87_1654910 [compost metagenome]